jgi:hypothetical protein
MRKLLNLRERRVFEFTDYIKNNFIYIIAMFLGLIFIFFHSSNVNANKNIYHISSHLTL